MPIRIHDVRSAMKQVQVAPELGALGWTDAALDTLEVPRHHRQGARRGGHPLIGAAPVGPAGS